MRLEFEGRGSNFENPSDVVCRYTEVGRNLILIKFD